VKNARLWTVPTRKVTDLYGTNIYCRIETASNREMEECKHMCNWFLNKINNINFDFDRNYHISHNTYSAVIQ